MWEEAGVCPVVALWRRGHRCHSRVGWEGHEMSRTLPVMPLVWRGHRFGHLGLCLVLVDVNDL